MAIHTRSLKNPLTSGDPARKGRRCDTRAACRSMPGRESDPPVSQRLRLASAGDFGPRDVARIVRVEIRAAAAPGAGPSCPEA